MNEHTYTAPEVHNMKMSVTAYNKTVTIEFPEDSDIREFIDVCKNLAMSAGYLESSWKDAVYQLVDEYEFEEKMSSGNNMKEMDRQYNLWYPM